MKKPATLIFGVDDVPPVPVTVLSGVQHVALVSVFLVYPILVFRLGGVTTELTANLLSVGFFVLGVATLLQALPRGPLGSGYLCPVSFTAIFLGPSLTAIKLGGLPLLFGMTLFAGIVQAVLSRLLGRLRPFLPTELSGFVVLMAGVTAGVAGVRYLVGTAGAPPLSPLELGIAAGTLALMAALAVWGAGLLKMICVLVGMSAGYAVAGFAGLIGEETRSALSAAPLVALPSLSHLHWSFDPALVIPFLIASIATTLKAMGTVTLSQRLNDADWVRPDMTSNRKGVLADGLGIALAGGLGTFGTNTSSANVALVVATGVASRRIAVVIAILLMLLGLLPKLGTLLALMPRPVTAAALVFTTCFLLVNGMQMITSRMMDMRRTLVIGLATVAGLTIEVFPAVARAVPGGMAPLFGSSLVFGTLVALLLNLLFRLGVKQTVRMPIDPGTDHVLPIEHFFKRHGAIWGALPDVVGRATYGTLQLVETVAENCNPRGPLLLEAAFDEFNLDVRLSYAGDSLEFPAQRPSNQDILDGEDGMRRLAGFMLRRNADAVDARTADGRVTVHFHFHH